VIIVAKPVTAHSSAPVPPVPAPALDLLQHLLVPLAAAAGTPTAPDLLAASSRLTQLHSDYQRELGDLWAATLARQRGAPCRPVVEPERDDRRFAAAAWREDPYYDHLKQSYLLTARFLVAAADAVAVAPAHKRRLRFYARQLADMLSPANFAATNPEVIRRALETGGESLAAGLRNLIGDVEKRRITQTDEGAFEVGRNLAVTPGAVVFENDLCQLIQYAPATPRVRARPFLMVPPCINKYYVLDLTPENSFVRWAVERGNTCFLVSWRNVTADCADFTWDDYIGAGLLKPIAVVREITGADRLNLLGYCVGGTMLGAALAVLAARGEDWVESATFFTALLDFADPGELAVFIDEPGVAAVERTIGQGGVKDGRDLAAVFNLLRANDLVWSYVVNGYLQGRAPGAFDLLYWNSDSTNLAGPWYAWYLRNAYLENNLCVPGRVSACGVPIDLGRIGVPAYVLATREDHIVPWRGAYRTTRLLGGESRFVLGASGHVAGVINPASKNRRSYWINDHLADDPDEWLAGAAEVKGSWWYDWDRWLARFGGGEVPAPGAPGSDAYRPIEPAPGRYVKARVV
jgi:polyhydroxyalkanoate synthase